VRAVVAASRASQFQRVCECEGDFLKRKSCVILLPHDDAEYPLEATQGGAPSGMRLQAGPACSAPPLFGRLSGCVQQSGDAPSMSYSAPPLPSCRHALTGFHSSAVLKSPSTARWDETCDGKGGNTAADSASPGHRTTAPCAATMASASHDFPGRSPCSCAAGSSLPAQSPPTPPTRLQGPPRCHHSFWRSCPRAWAPARALHLRSHTAGTARASPRRDHTPGCPLWGGRPRDTAPMRTVA